MDWLSFFRRLNFLHASRKQQISPIEDRFILLRLPSRLIRCLVFILPFLTLRGLHVDGSVFSEAKPLCPISRCVHLTLSDAFPCHNAAGVPRGLRGEIRLCYHLAFIPQLPHKSLE